MLEQVQPDSQNRRGFRAAAAGLVLQIAHREEPVEALPWLLRLLTGCGISGVKGLKDAAKRVAKNIGSEKYEQSPVEEDRP